MGTEYFFENRSSAGEQLANTPELQEYKNSTAFVLAIPRGGVEVGYEIAKRLGLPLSVLVAQKVRSQHNPEFGVGAVSEYGVTVIDLQERGLEENISEARKELIRRVVTYRPTPLPSLKERAVILVDDGIATGVTTEAAILTLVKLDAQKIALATPVSAKEAKERLTCQVDQFVCILVVEDLEAVGMYYKNFEQVNDEQVQDYLESARLGYTK
jgi:putative phosphoribosyl transferase